MLVGDLTTEQDHFKNEVHQNGKSDVALERFLSDLY